VSTFYFYFHFFLLLYTNRMLFFSCMCPASNNLTEIIDSSVNYYYLTVIIWMKNKVFLMRLFLFLCHVKNLFLIYAGSHINIITDQWWCLQSFPNKFYELIDCTFFYELYFSYLNSEYMLHYLDKLYWYILVCILQMIGFRLPILLRIWTQSLTETQVWNLIKLIE
jgi:hypothetical protein